MKMILLIGLLALLSCGQPTTDAANDAAGTADPNLAREVTGVWLLTTDYSYDRLCEFLDEGFVRGTFNVEPLSEFTLIDSQTQCRYVWPTGSVTVAFGGNHPYASIYHAEYAFDKRYQPAAADEIEQPVDKPSLFGPSPQGTASEWPAHPSPRPEHDSLAIIDSAVTGSGIHTRLTERPYSTERQEAISDVGDKALWNPTRRTLNVLYLNHILGITVNSPDKPTVQRQQAIRLARVMIEKIGQADR